VKIFDVIKRSEVELKIRLQSDLCYITILNMFQVVEVASVV
jgi:hypothetical protein